MIYTLGNLNFAFSVFQSVGLHEMKSRQTDGQLSLHPSLACSHLPKMKPWTHRTIALHQSPAPDHHHLLTWTWPPQGPRVSGITQYMPFYISKSIFISWVRVSFFSKHSGPLSRIPTTHITHGMFEGGHDIPLLAVVDSTVVNSIDFNPPGTM